MTTLAIQQQAIIGPVIGIDAEGTPAPLGSVPVWSVSDPAILTVTPDASGRFGLVTTKDQYGKASVHIEADADLSAGVAMLAVDYEFEVVPPTSQAVELRANISQPVNPGAPALPGQGLPTPPPTAGWPLPGQPPSWGGPVDPGYGRPEIPPNYPGGGPVYPSRPVDPGYGRPEWSPVDPGYGQGGWWLFRPDNSLPWAPVRPGWPTPPVYPGQGLPQPPVHIGGGPVYPPVYPSGGPVFPGRPVDPSYGIPDWAPVRPGWPTPPVRPDAGLPTPPVRPDAGLPSAPVRPDNTLPETPEPKTKKRF